MDFLRLHLPGLHQALRGALDSLGTFVSYLLGDAVPTVEWEAQAAEELRAVAVGRTGKIVEEEAQEALEGLRGSQSQGAGGLRGPGDDRRREAGSSAVEQTWDWGDGSSHGSQAERQDSGAGETAKAARCQEPSAPLEARKKSKAWSGACQDSSGQAQERQEPDEQEVNREERLRSWGKEEEEKEEEVRAREPGMARGAESEWTWHGEWEGKAGAAGPKAAGDNRKTEQGVREADAGETEEAGAEGAGKGEEVVVVEKACESTRAWGTWGPGAEPEDWGILGREEAGTTPGREEARTILDGEEARTISGEEEAETASGREEAGTASGGEEAGTASGGEEAGTASGGEAGTASGGEEAGTASGGDEAWTTSGREAGTASGGEEARTASSGEAGTASGDEEAGTASGGDEAWTTSGKEEADLPGVRQTEYGAVPGERLLEATGKVWVLEEEGDEGREAEVSPFPEQAQVLSTERTEEAAESQTAGREAVGGQEAGESFEGQADLCGKEAEMRWDLEIRADQARLEELIQAEEAQEERRSSRDPAAELPSDGEAEGAVDLEATPEARPEEELTGEESEVAQTSCGPLGVEWGGLTHRITKGQGPELMGGTQTPTKQPEEREAGEVELMGVLALSKEEQERSLEAGPRPTGSVKPEGSEAFPGAWENRTRRDMERRNTQEDAADGEQREEEAAGGQTPAAEAEGDRESELSEVPEAGGEGPTTQDAGCGIEEGEVSVSENQKLDGSTGADAGPCLSLGEAYARETEDGEAEADKTSRRGWRLQAVAVGLQDREDAQIGSVAAGIMGGEVVLDVSAAGASEAMEGAPGQGWDSKEKEEAAAGEHAGGQEFGLEGSAEEKVAGRGGQVEAFESREGGPGGGRVEAEESAGAEDSCGLDRAGSQTVRAEGMGAMVKAGGLLEEWTLLEEEAVGRQEREQREDSEGRCGDHHPEGEAPRLLDAEGLMVTGDWRAEAKETEPESLEDVRGQEERPTYQAPAEAAPESVGEAEMAEAMGSARGVVANSWSEAPLPGSLLDVSVPRSRVHLLRSSSQRRSRPSFRRTPAWEQQKEPPAPNPPEEELSAPEQRPLQLEERLEPSPLRHDGTPVPARRRPLGHGFGLTHPGMMQELQARLSRPKPQ
ncbi:apolipoprotein B receptor isoform X1 [Hylobates moloch]|uniref:apolipoprotein B receptor isoform X1 n=2 Tax=Hylobates moloch TaxID=81572 RepID=UPI001362DB6F|nr:apolipoprotein B receptor isoform X1 [Hylobates moloch]